MESITYMEYASRKAKVPELQIKQTTNTMFDSSLGL